VLGSSLLCQQARLGAVCSGNFDALQYQVFDGAHSMSDKPKEENSSTEKATVTLPGTVEKIIPPVVPSEPEKAQIAVHGAEELYREIRVENTLQDEAGNPVSLKKDAEVEVTIAADPEATKPKDKP
jgi:hypothetical protein